MQLFLITHLTAVRVLFIIGIVLVVLPVIFFILKSRKIIAPPVIVTRAAVIGLIAGILCFILPVYYLYLDAEFDIGEYSDADILYIASESMDPKAVERMLKRGASPSEKTRFGKTALYNSVEKQDHESVRIMAEYGADLNNSGKGHYTPLCAACKNGDITMVQLLLTRGADPDYRPEQYVSALSCAAAYDEGYNYEMINLLCAAGADKQAVSLDSRGMVMVPFKYYFHKSIGVELSPEDSASYEKIAALLENDYREWVMENASFLNDRKEIGVAYEAVS